jgi:predicted RNA-binding protein
MTHHWIIVASRDHVRIGVAGGFAQACHGKCSPLQRIKEGDTIIYYSPKITFGQPEVCQSFTALGDVVDSDVFQVATSPDFVPFRRRVAYRPCREVPIHPLIESLSFIPNKQHWGAPFRYGILSIPSEDYRRIAEQMLPG